MLAYRVNFSGTHDHYLITEKQKPALDSALKENRGVVVIGGDTIRVSSIKSVTQVDVDVPSCPPYFQAQVKREQEIADRATSHGFHKFPTEWLILSLDGKIIKTDLAIKSVAEVTNSLLAQGDPEENKNLRFIAAKCHFKFGTDGVKQYFIDLKQIPEALKCFPNAENPGHMVVRQIYVYGIPQLPVK